MSQRIWTMEHYDLIRMSQIMSNVYQSKDRNVALAVVHIKVLHKVIRVKISVKVFESCTRNCCEHWSRLNTMSDSWWALAYGAVASCHWGPRGPGPPPNIYWIFKEVGCTLCLSQHSICTMEHYDLTRMSQYYSKWLQLRLVWRYLKVAQETAVSIEVEYNESRHRRVSKTLYYAIIE